MLSLFFIMRIGSIKAVVISIIVVLTALCFIAPFVVFTKEERKLFRFSFEQWYERKIVPIFFVFSDSWHRFKSRFVSKEQVQAHESETFREVSHVVA